MKPNAFSRILFEYIFKIVIYKVSIVLKYIGFVIAVCKRKYLNIEILQIIWKENNISIFFP